MNIDNLTLGQIKQISNLFQTNTEHSFPVGHNVFIRCVTHYYTGKLVRVTSGELVLEDAAWIADTGRFSDALYTGKLNEVEPFPSGEVFVNRGAVVDVSRWTHSLPRTAK